VVVASVGNRLTGIFHCSDFPRPAARHVAAARLGGAWCNALVNHPIGSCRSRVRPEPLSKRHSGG
jgi:hypothetical protein